MPALDVTAWGVVVPVKRLTRAKTRLGAYGSVLRAELALAFAADVVAAALGESAFDRIERDASYSFTDEIRAALEWNLDSEQASRITVPTLLVTGGDSAAVTSVYDETATILAGMLPFARRVVLPGVRHSMPLQDPAGVARLVRDAVSV